MGIEWGDFSIGEKGRVDDDIAFLLAKAAELKLPPLGAQGPVAARAEFARRLSRTNPQPPEGVAAEELLIGGGLAARRYAPAAGVRASAVLLYFHGGGFVVGDLDTHDAICRTIAARSGSWVVSVDYRMGPEHPYPAAVADGVTALRWLAAEPFATGLKLGVAGDSAGGSLAAVVALHARDQDIPLAVQILVYPATDQRGDYPSRRRLAEGYLLTQADIEWFTENYFAGRAFPVLEPDASPLLAESHGGLAPALVLTCGFDPLVDEGQAYAAKLVEAGVPVRSVCLEGSIHGSLGLAGYVASGKAALDEICASWNAAIS